MDEYTAKPGVDWGAVDRGIQTEVGLRQFENEQKAQAIRWQGQQDYETLIKSGVDPMESLRRTAPKLFFNDPRGLASAVEEISRPRQGRIVTMDGVQGVLQPNGQFIPLRNYAQDLTNKRNVRTSFKDPEGVTVTQNFTPEEFAETRKQAAIIVHQGNYKKAREAHEGSSWNPLNWGANESAMETEREILGNLGIDASTGKPLVSFTGASGPMPGSITQDQATAWMNANRPTPAQAVDETRKRFPGTVSGNASKDKILVVRPDGKIGEIPVSQLEDALKQGFKPAK